MSPTVAEHPASARDRLLAAADELFYQEGINSVGIDRVIEHAGVAKATLYSTFGSKDELVRSYLERRHLDRIGRVTAALAECESPREKILAVFDVQGRHFRQGAFHGCAFLNANAEARSGGGVESISAEYRGWLRELFGRLAVELGAGAPGDLAARLVLLYDGAGVGAKMDRDPGAVTVARGVAELLLERAVPSS